MKTKIFRPVQARVPFSTKALEATLNRLEEEFESYRATRDRDAVFRYLSAVFEAVQCWDQEAKTADYAREALRLRNYRTRTEMGPFAAVIVCSAGRETVDAKTVSKWSRVLRYVAEYKKPSEPLDAFIKRKGGINECAARFTVRLGPKSTAGVRQPRSNPRHAQREENTTCK